MESAGSILAGSLDTASCSVEAPGVPIGDATSGVDWNRTIGSAQPTIGGWEIDGTLVASGMRILTDSATFGMTITDDVPTLGIASVVASLDGGGDMPATLGNDNRFAVAYSGLSDGGHSLTLTATEGSGKWSCTCTAVDIVRFQFGESPNGATAPSSYLLDGDVDNAVTNLTTDGAHYVMVRAIDAAGNVGE